ncbi:hypothetical protein F4809DRAFT_638989 [Biscogniauxia mediterranea]|nr:hypothetical protein F4809DRAFT_638989 [Biscogniauxia mediterranea]
MSRTIQDLSPQLLARCCQFLTPSPLPTVGHKYRQDEDRELQYTLMQICKVSRAFKKAAQPSLYRNIVIHNESQAVKLFRSLFNYAHLRPMVISFAFPFDIYYEREEEIVTNSFLIWLNKTFGSKENSVIRHMMDVNVDRLWDPEFLTSPGGISFRRPDISRINVEMWYIEGKEDAIIQSVVAGIILLAENLEDILLKAPKIASGRQFSLTLDRVLRLGYLTGTTMKNLKSLRFYASLAALFLSRGYARVGGINPECIPPYRIGQTERLETYGDCGAWEAMFEAYMQERSRLLYQPKYRIGVACLPKLTELKLYQSRTAPYTLYRILGHCENLRSLAYTTRRQEWKHCYRAMRRTTIDFALRAAATQLETLHFEALHRAGPETAAQTDAAWERIACLPRFAALRHLTIDAGSLLGATHGARRRNHHQPLFSRCLPPNLETLTVTSRLCASDLALYGADADARAEHLDGVRAHLALLLLEHPHPGRGGDGGGALRRLVWTFDPLFRYRVVELPAAEFDMRVDQYRPFRELKTRFAAERGVAFEIEWAVTMEWVHEGRKFSVVP